MEKLYQRAVQELELADQVLVSASNGLSIAGGYHIFADNEAFRQYFGKFREKYGIHSIIQGVFAPLPQEVHAEFMSQLRKYFVMDYQPTEVMQNLKELLASKDYFVVTSNADTHFQLNGFAEDRLFEVEGNFIDMPEGSAEWKQQSERFNAFVQRSRDSRLVVLELGIGARNQLIKAPLMELVDGHLNAFYITLNLAQEINIPAKLADCSLGVAGDIGESFRQMLKARQL